MIERWWSLPQVAWPVGIIIGIVGTIIGNSIWESLRRKYRGRREYLSISYSNDVIHLEGQYKTTVSIQEIAKQITQQLEEGAKKQPYLDINKFDLKIPPFNKDDKF